MQHRGGIFFPCKCFYIVDVLVVKKGNNMFDSLVGGVA